MSSVQSAAVTHFILTSNVVPYNVSFFLAFAHFFTYLFLSFSSVIPIGICVGGELV